MKTASETVPDAVRNIWISEKRNRGRYGSAVPAEFRQKWTWMQLTEYGGAFRNTYYTLSAKGLTHQGLSECLNSFNC